jgi:hypothetical protein
MLFDLTVPCYLTTFSGKKCLSGKVICAFFCPAYRSSHVFWIPYAGPEVWSLGSFEIKPIRRALITIFLTSGGGFEVCPWNLTADLLVWWGMGEL